MSPETNEPEPLPRRSPKLFPDAPPPLEPAEPPRQVFRLRTDVPAPGEGPSKDKARELFFITWKAQNPGGKADSEDFERAYGDFQIRQSEAKGYYREHELTTPWWPTIRRALLIGFLIVAAIAGFNWIRAKFEVRPPAPRSSSLIGRLESGPRFGAEPLKLEARGEREESLVPPRSPRTPRFKVKGCQA